MNKRLVIALCVVLAILLNGFSAVAQPPEPGVPVEIVAQPLRATPLQQDAVAEIVADALQPSADVYRKAKVRVLPDYMIVYLLPKDSWSFETVKIALGADNEIVSVERGYVENASDYPEQAGATYACPDDTVEAVVSTCETGISTAVEGVNTVYNKLTNAGWNAEKLLGSEENTTDIKNWLSCPNLKYFGRIGHGSTTGIMLSNGTLSYTYFQSADLQGKVVLLEVYTSG